MKKLVPILLTLCLLLLSLCACGASGAKSEPLRFVTGSETGTYYAYGSVLAQYASGKAGLDITAVSSGGSRANVEDIASGGAQLGFCQSDVASYAFHGTSLFADSGALDGFSVVAALYMENIQIVTLDPAIKTVEDLLRELDGRTEPDFFRIGFYKLQKPQEDLHSIPVEELNEKTRAFLDENFMNDFLQMEEKGVAYSFQTALEKKKKVVETLRASRDDFTKNKPSRSAAHKWANDLAEKVEDSIDRMEIVKDSSAYTFRYAINDAIDRYFNAVKRNPKEEARFARQSKRRDALIARGRTVDWKVVPKVVYDLDELEANISKSIDNMAIHYDEYIAKADTVDCAERSVQIVDYLKDRGSQMVHRVTHSMAREKAIQLMEEVGIPEPRIRYNQYPFEFSGGMRQRIVIAIALAANPDILICDEPTTALDVTIQAQILELINNLKAERNLSVIFITHDLGVVANMADDIAVMYAGKIVEYGTADEIFYDPRHPYTWALLSSMPDLDTKEKLDAIPGTPPNMIYPPEGDAFAARNKYAMQIDFEMQPPAFEVSPTHWAASWLLHPDAPKVDPPKIITDRIERMKKRAGGEL